MSGLILNQREAVSYDRSGANPHFFTWARPPENVTSLMAATKDLPYQ
jgi:hypothetical protein